MSHAARGIGFVAACRTVEQLGLAIWIGGLLLIIGAVIPAVFNSLPMETAGRFLRQVFDGYNRLVGLAITLLLIGGLGRVWQSRRVGVARAMPRREIILLIIMITIAALITFVLVPHTVVLQERAFAATEPAKQAAYDEFFFSHQVVRGLYLLNLALGILLVRFRAAEGIGR